MTSWERDQERNTLTREIVGCQHENEYKTEISVQEFSYYEKLCRHWNAASLCFRTTTALQFEWYSTKRGYHTPLQDDGRHVEPSNG